MTAFSVVDFETVPLDLRLRVRRALALAARDLDIAVPAVHWYVGDPPEGYLGTESYGGRPPIGFVTPTLRAVWLRADLDLASAARVAAHEAKHVEQLARGETDLGSEINEAAAAEYEAWFARVHGWRFA